MMMKMKRAKGSSKMAKEFSNNGKRTLLTNMIGMGSTTR